MAARIVLLLDAPLDEGLQLGLVAFRNVRQRCRYLVLGLVILEAPYPVVETGSLVKLACLVSDRDGECRHEGLNFVMESQVLDHGLEQPDGRSTSCGPLPIHHSEAHLHPLVGNLRLIEVSSGFYSCGSGVLQRSYLHSDKQSSPVSSGRRVVAGNLGNLWKP
jgi:hypothetical protein